MFSLKNLKKISQDLISKLPQREKEIILRRFGLQGRKKESLQSIGNSFGITRERVRQIENQALKKIKPRLKKYIRIIHQIKEYFKKEGGVKSEEVLLAKLGKNNKNELLFLLEISGEFERKNQDKKIHSFWFLKNIKVEEIKEKINNLIEIFKREKKLMSLKELSQIAKVEKQKLKSLLEISKEIQKNEKELWGLKEWPEINPRGAKDKAYVLLKELKKPLHFTEIAKLIGKVNVATVHNELIKDERFVLIGRGIYALKEWGYFPGEVKDVILKILQEKGRPLTKKEILEEVKKHRLVKESTILVNLANKELFERDEKGRYKIKTTQI